MYKNVFFDLDGTICNSLPGIINGIQYAMQRIDKRSLSDAEIKKLIGTPLNESLKVFYPKSPDKIRETVTVFREYYAVKGLFESELYFGVTDLISGLEKQSKLFLVTAKPTVFAEKMLDFHGISAYFSSIQGYEDQMPIFKKSDLILATKADGKSIMIGDKKEDIDAGKEAGIDTCGILYGYGSREEVMNSNPTFCCANVEEMRTLLLHSYVSV